MVLLANLGGHLELSFAHLGAARWPIATAWYFVPWVLAAYAMLLHPRAGLAFTSGWVLAGTNIPFVAPLLLTQAQFVTHSEPGDLTAAWLGQAL